jgi:hypothetical protein
MIAANDSQRCAAEQNREPQDGRGARLGLSEGGVGERMTSHPFEAEHAATSHSTTAQN